MPSPDTLLLTPHYLPSIAYIQTLISYPQVHLDTHIPYQKKTFFNRAYISHAKGPLALTVPIQHASYKKPYRDTRICYEQAWNVKHLRTLATAYGKAPYYHTLSDLLFPILEKRHAFLLDLTLPLLHAILRFLQHPISIDIPSEAPIMLPHTHDLRHTFHPKKPPPQPLTTLPHYPHIFDIPFTPNLSVIDLLYAQGPHAKDLLK